MTARRFPSACTIVSRNYLSDARVLAESYLKYHPGARFYTLVVDNPPEEVDAGAGNQIIGPDELELPYLPELYFKCNATELCITLKPPLMRLLFDRYEEPEVVYFDSDILVMRRLDELIGALSAANILLTPHLLKPIPLDGLLPNEQDILRAGTFNLGFIAVRRSPVARNFLDWWQERMRDGCFIEASGGLLTDQRWNDLTPSLFSAASLRDETYNVAYWNLHSRPIERDGQTFLVNGRPLAFFHFSGFDPREPAVLSKHQNRIRIEKGSGLSDLLDLYIGMQKQRGFDATRQSKYGYGYFDNGVAVSSPMRNVYNSLPETQRKAFGDPFRTAGDDSFFAWATRPDSASTLSPFLKSLYALRPDLAAAFPDVEGKHREAFLKWARTDGASEFRYDPLLMRIAVEGPSRATAAVAMTGTGRRCSVIIPVYNHAAVTRHCLESIFSSASVARDFEVIVADDGSSDATGELLQSYGARIRVVSHAANAGFARSCNDAAAIAAGEYLIFLNNDTTGQSGWLDALVGYADRHPEAAAVGSKLLFPNDTIQHAGLAIGEDGEPRHIYIGFPADHAAVNRSRRFQAVTGACVLIRRQDFETSRGFDSSFANGYEDVDLCLRLGESGREIHYCHESVLYHLEAVTREVRIDDGRNRDLYLKRWANRVRPDELHYYVEDQLLKIDHRPIYPIGISVAPLLAVIDGAERELRVDRLLESRSRQVLGLLKDAIRLNVRVQEMEQHSQRMRVDASARSHDSRTFAEPRVVCRGSAQWQSDQSSGRIISIILPIKNGAAKLRDLLPAIRAQQTRDQVEIVAVDSASTDESVDLLKQSNATVVAIDPRSFNHGLTRNLATRYARGSVYVFLNQSTLPADEHWLANLIRPLESDPSLAGVCGRVLPRKDADLLVAREISRNVNAGTERIVTAITDWQAYRSLAPEQLRLFVNFHSLSAAIRAEVFEQIPFREANFAEDLIWGKEALEAGYRIQYEPSSLVFHSHNYSLLDTFRRNFDDGAACAAITGRKLAESDVAPGIVHLIREDWRYLEECHLEGRELEQWRLASAMNRAAQIIGHWLGVNRHGTESGLVRLLSITEQIKAGAKTEEPERWRVTHASDAG